MIRSTSLVAALLLAGPGCPPSPAPPPPVALDASKPPVDASTAAEAACANLRALGCVEGTAGDCAATLDHMAASRITRVDVACLARAATKAEARACGSVSCPE